MSTVVEETIRTGPRLSTTTPHHFIRPIEGVHGGDEAQLQLAGHS